MKRFSMILAVVLSAMFLGGCYGSTYGYGYVGPKYGYGPAPAKGTSIYRYTKQTGPNAGRCVGQCYIVGYTPYGKPIYASEAKVPHYPKPYYKPVVKKAYKGYSIYGSKAKKVKKR